MNDFSSIGIINILFYQGSSGTFLANMVSEALRDPWNSAYVPNYHSTKYAEVNEYTNPHRHLVDVWHTYSIEDLIDLQKTKNSQWVSIQLTPENFLFSSSINAIKRQHKENWTTLETVNEIRRHIKLNSTNADAYNNYMNDHYSIENKLEENNRVLKLNYNDIFINGKLAIIQSIFDLIYPDFSNNSVIENIATQCIKKHERDVELYRKFVLEKKLIDDVMFT